MDKAYQQIRVGRTANWKEFITQTAEYDFTDGEEMAYEIRVYLAEEIEGGNRFVTQFKRDREERLNALSWEFSKYMFAQKDVGFLCSEAIWSGVLEFLEERKPSRRKSVAPNIYFGFSDAELDEYLGKMIGGFMSMRQADGVAILWGIPYIYELLLSKEIITDSVYQEAIKSVASLKPPLIQAFQNSLWQYNFVHRWRPPNSVSRKDFAVESEKFKETIKVKIPLSNKPTKGEMDFFGGVGELRFPFGLDNIENSFLNADRDRFCRIIFINLDDLR